jgi:CRISPR-associated protein Cas2
MYVLVYDVVNDRRRNKLHRTLKDYGTAVQRSVFEFDLNAAEVQKMMKRVEALISPDEDTVRLYRLCAACLTETRIFGEGVLSLDPDFYII